jgi:2-keto-3-deoxy-L-rhamnonate aldolase RhmA
MAASIWRRSGCRPGFTSGRHNAARPRGELSYSLAARALDVGAQGIILPRVEEPELLREA